MVHALCHGQCARLCAGTPVANNIHIDAAFFFGGRAGGRLATSVRQVTRDQMEQGPTGSDTGRSWFLLSSGCDRSRYYRVPHGTGPIPNDTPFPCRTLVACLAGGGGGALRRTSRSFGGGGGGRGRCRQCHRSKRGMAPELEDPHADGQLKNRLVLPIRSDEPLKLIVFFFLRETHALLASEATTCLPLRKCCTGQNRGAHAALRAVRCRALSSSWSQCSGRRCALRKVCSMSALWTRLAVSAPFESRRVYCVYPPPPPGNKIEICGRRESRVLLQSSFAAPRDPCCSSSTALCRQTRSKRDQTCICNPFGPLSFSSGLGLSCKDQAPNQHKTAWPHAPEERCCASDVSAISKFWAAGGRNPLRLVAVQRMS